MSQAKQIDIDAVSGPELDALVAVEVMGWKKMRYRTDHEPRKDNDYEGLHGWETKLLTPDGEMCLLDEWEGSTPVPFPDDAEWDMLPKFSTDANHVREVEAEIERRELVFPYVENLRAACAEASGLDAFGLAFDNDAMFKLITATPEQRCRAALKAAMG